MMNYSVDNRAILREKRQLGLLYGLVAGGVFAITAWGVDAFILFLSNAYYPWLQFFIGLIPTLAIGGIAGWLTYRINHFLAAFVLWLLAGLAFSWLAIHISASFLTQAIRLLNPTFGQLIFYPQPTSQQMSPFIVNVVATLLPIIAGMLEMGLVDMSSDATGWLGRYIPMILWIAIFIFAGLSVEDNLTQPLRQPMQNTNTDIQFLIDHLNQNIDQKTALQMRTVAFNDVQNVITRPRRLLLSRYDDSFYNTIVLVNFGGNWVTCSLVNSQPNYCKATTPEEIVKDTNEWIKTNYPDDYKP